MIQFALYRAVSITIMVHSSLKSRLKCGKYQALFPSLRRNLFLKRTVSDTRSDMRLGVCSFSLSLSLMYDLILRGA